jgi:DNA uptake protein ComE-like DNA-binding protein
MPLWVSPQRDLLLLADEKMLQLKKHQDIHKREPVQQAIPDTGSAPHQSSDHTELFPFDPNKLSEADGEKLGFTKRQIQNIQHYLRAGGRFRKKTDLLKLYSIDEFFFDKIEAFVLLPDSAIVTASENKKFNYPASGYKSQAKSILDINSADSVQLVDLSGIGPSFAKRILKYRNQLGGFVNPEQLMEVWGFTDSLFKIVLPQIFIKADAIKKIKINSATVEQLKNHPYIWKFNIARAIINYREQHGSYRSVDDLRKVVLVSDSTISKLRPYIDLE